MELLSVIIGFVLGLIGTAFGTILHMRWLDRTLLPAPPPKKPHLTLVDKQETH